MSSVKVTIINFVLYVILNSLLVDSKYVSGSLLTNQQWIFLTRFCFLSDSGELTYEFEIPSTIAPIDFLFYYDEPQQWYSVYKKNVRCEDAIKEPYLNPNNYQVISLGNNTNNNYLWTGCSNQGDVVVCSSTRKFSTVRERWWFMAIARCSNHTIGGLYLKYKLHMMNGDDYLTKEFSADEFHILETDIFFLMAFIFVLILAGLCAHKLRERMLFHTTYKMFLLTTSLEITSLIIICIAYGKFANTGMEDLDLKTFGRVIDAAAHIIFLLMLLLLGKGYNVTRGRLSQSSSIKILVFIAAYSLIYAILFFDDALFSDPGLVLYLYESPPGYGLIALRIVAWVYFSFACFMTLKHYPEKKKFYYPFYFFYSVWFLIGPIFVLIACFAIPKYKREKIVNGIEVAISFLSHSYLLFLTRPSNTNKNFPYHVRTSQVGILEDSAQPDDKMNFTRTAYAPTSNYEQTGPDFRNMFNVVKNVYYRDSLKPTVVEKFETNDGVQSPRSKPPKELDSHIYEEPNKVNDNQTKTNENNNGNITSTKYDPRIPSAVEINNMFTVSK